MLKIVLSAIITHICSSFLVQFGSHRDKCLVAGGTGDKSLLIASVLTISVQLAPMREISSEVCISTLAQDHSVLSLHGHFIESILSAASVEGVFTLTHSGVDLGAA